MAAEKLYYEDAYMRTCEAVVTGCAERKGGYAVTLDRTCFYPEGGGQPGDRGTLSGITVTDTHEKDGEVLHYTDVPIAAGTRVTAQIDWEHRFDLMQQHSGEHMVSGVIHRRWGYENVGFHMGADMITIDLSGILTMEELQEVEREVNRRIWEDTPVICRYPDPEELKTIPYRSKKALPWPVRIVEIPGADICACCGTHVATTGQIGLVKLLSVQKFHSGVRVEMLCGGRADEYLRGIQRENREISHQLSAKPLETAAAVKALGKELEMEKQHCAGLESALFAMKAEALRGRGNVLLREEGLSPDSLRRLALAVMETCGGRAAAFSGDDASGYRYAIGAPEGDLRPFVKELNGALQGRGGGKAGFVQGSVMSDWAGIAGFFENR